MAGIARSSLGAREQDHDHDQDVEPPHEDAAIWPGKVARTDELHAVRDDRLGDISKLRRVLQTMQGGGQELPQGVAAQFSRLLGSDLSGVRVHTSGPASEQAGAIQARAFTHGAHIAFAPGTYDPESAATRHVLAHELVHVLQNQRSGGQAMQLAARLDVGPSGSSVESEAEAGAHALIAGQPFTVPSRRDLPGVSLFGGNDPVPEAPLASPSSSASASASPSSSSSATEPAAPEVTPASAIPAPAGAPVPADTPAAAGTSSAPSPAPAGTAAPAAATPGTAGSGGAGPGPSADVDPAAPRPAAAPTPAGEAKALDARIAEILEQRADPAAKTTYQKGIGQVQSLRLQALQYSFQKSGFGNTLFQTLVFPTEAVADHWGQVYATNAYRGGNGNAFVDGLQSTIEGLRGLLHIVGDLAAIVSAWAGMVAIVAGLIALIGAETGVLAVVGGIVAAIADSVSVMAGLLKIMLDCLDALLGFVQMIILVIRARCSKDPGERARFAQLLHKEAGDMAANIVGVSMQCAVLVATAGVGVGMTKGISKMFTKEFGHAFGEELGKLLNPRIVFKGGIKGVVDKFAVRQVGKGVKAPLGGKSVAVAGEDVLKLSVLKRVGGRVTKERQIVSFTTKNQMNGARLVRCNAALKKIAAMDAAAVPSGGLTVATLIVQSKAPNPGSIGQAGGGGRIEVPEKPAGAVTTVGAWPSLLEQFSNAKEPLAGAITRTEEQYENARTQAGADLGAAVDAKLREVAERSHAQTATATTVGSDAREGKANTDRGGDLANKGNAEKTKASATQGKIDSETTKVQTAGGQLKPPPPKDGVLGTVYNMTIGTIGGWIGSAQAWLKNFLGKGLMLAAGFSKQDLDLAGIEDDMRTDSTRDSQSEKDATETQAEADPVQQAVYELMADKSTDEQAAIQGMAEAKGLIEALEEADRSLDEAIESGSLYIEAVTPILQHELATQTEGKAIDGAYVAPVIGYADAFVASIQDDSTGQTAQASADDLLAEMHAAFSGLAVGPGRTQIAAIVSQYETARSTEVMQAKSGAEQIKAQVVQFVGTTDYAGVNANAQALDRLAHDFDGADNLLGDELYREINLVLQAHLDAIDKAIADAMAAPDGAVDQTGDPNPTPVARKADGAGIAPDAQAALDAAAHSHGAGLPAAQREELEQKADVDLSRVRIHTGAASQQAAAAVGAKAYTVGQDIHFGAGQYDPVSLDGQHLIAHEVAHTIQQREGAPSRQHELEVSAAEDHSELEADRFADSVIRGGAPAAMSAQRPIVARETLSGTNPAERTDATGAAITRHRAATLGDTTNPPATIAPPTVVSRTANVRVVATELAPLHVAGATCPEPGRVFQEGPAVSPPPSGYTEVTGQQGTVDAPMLEQTADPGLYIANQPTANDVQQGGIGDCYFMATLMGVAARDPGHLKSIMAADGSGGASVTLYRREAQSRGFLDWLTDAAPTYTYIPVVVSVSADLAVRVSNNRVYGAQLHCAPGPKAQEYFARISGTNLEVHRKDTFEVARWAPLMEKAYARFAQVHGQYGGAHDGHAAGGSGYAGIDGGIGTHTYSVLYGAAAAAASADVHDVQVNSFPAGGGSVLAANPRVVDQLCLLAGRGEAAAPGDTTAPLILANTDPDSQVLNLEKAIPLAIADPDWAAIGATRQAKIIAIQTAITAWKALPPDTGSVTSKKTAMAAIGTACAEAARTPNTDYLANLRSWVRDPIPFANDSDAVPADRIAGLHTMGRNIDIMIGNGTLVPFNIEVVGHASSSGDAAHNQTLSEGRATNVSTTIQAGGTHAANMAKNNFAGRGIGSAGAGPGPEWRRADVTVEPQQTENELLGAARSVPLRRLMDLVLTVRNLGTDHSGGQRNVYAGHAYSVLSVSFVTTARVPVPLASVSGAARQAMFPQVDAMVSSVRLRNPHHGNEPDRDGMNHDVPGDGIPAGPTADGAFTMTLDGFFRNFNWIGSGVLPKT